MFSSSGGQKPKAKVSAGLHLLWGFSREFISLPFPASRDLLHSLTAGSFLPLQNLSLQTLVPSPCLLFLILSLLPLSCKKPGDYIGPTWVIHKKCSHLKILNLITAANSLARVCKLLASLGHTERRRVVLGQVLNTQT